MNQIQPRITRRELQQLIRQQSWQRLGKRLEQAAPEDISAQLPGLQPEHRQILLRLMTQSTLTGVRKPS